MWHVQNYGGAVDKKLGTSAQSPIKDLDFETKNSVCWWTHKKLQLSLYYNWTLKNNHTPHFMHSRTSAVRCRL